MAGFSRPNPRLVGRYALFDEIASGGMASVHVGRLVGPVGFSRTVAIKRLHPQFAKDPEFVTMFLDEARLAARIRHPNVVPTLDVVASHGELFLVMEFVLGESFAKLLTVLKGSGQRAPLDVVSGVVCGVLHGLHAAHEAKNERGEPLGIVHRDVSPQNIMIGIDGVARVLDFGIAKAAGRAQVTREGQVRGKMAYIAPEQFQLGTSDRKVDLYAAAVVLWEALTGQRLFLGESEQATIAKVLTGDVPIPSSLVPDIPPELDRVVMRGLNRDRAERFQTARDMALALEACGPLATASRIGEWVETTGGTALANRSQAIAEIEQIQDLPMSEPLRPEQPRNTAEEPTAVEVRTAALVPDSIDDATQALDTPAAPKRRPKLMALAAAGGVVLLVLLFWLSGRNVDQSTATGHASALSAEPMEIAPQPGQPAPPEVSPVTPPASAEMPGQQARPAGSSPALEAPTEPRLPASATPAPSAGLPATSATSAAPAAPSKPVTGGRKTRPAPKGGCNPPYEIDPSGHRRYKMECL